MAGPMFVRKIAALILLVWICSATITATHHHCECCEHHHEQDEAPCSVCIAIEQAPVLVSFAKAETFEAERDVVAWISPWIALVPADVFFDRPLARGPPAVS